MQSSTNSHLKFLVDYALENNECILRKNLNYVSELIGVGIFDIVNDNIKARFVPMDDWRIKIINELIDIIDDEFEYNVDIEVSDLKSMLHMLVTE